MDAVYIYRHSPFDDFEIRYSLRSLEQHAPYIRKVWIFGDRPKFLSDDCSIVQHVPHDYTARILGVRPPVTNFCLLMVLASLIPELEFEYLQWSDDHFLLKDYPIEEARKVRYHSDMATRTPGRGMGQWSQTLWRTVSTLLRLGYTAYNFESHTPRRLTKKMVFEAYSDFREFITEDRFFGFTGPTAILNHGLRHEPMELVKLSDENSICGFWYSQPEYEKVIETSIDKTFLNFDDAAFGDGLRRFLTERFPNPSRFENLDVGTSEPELKKGNNPDSKNLTPELFRQFLSVHFPDLLKIVTNEEIEGKIS